MAELVIVSLRPNSRVKLAWFGCCSMDGVEMMYLKERDMDDRRVMRGLVCRQTTQMGPAIPVSEALLLTRRPHDRAYLHVQRPRKKPGSSYASVFQANAGALPPLTAPCG
jgi:hypothetical protein